METDIFIKWLILQLFNKFIIINLSLLVRGCIFEVGGRFCTWTLVKLFAIQCRRICAFGDCPGVITLIAAGRRHRGLLTCLTIVWTVLSIPQQISACAIWNVCQPVPFSAQLPLPIPNRRWSMVSQPLAYRMDEGQNAAHLLSKLFTVKCGFGPFYVIL
jgi:hypothetical protein